MDTYMHKTMASVASLEKIEIVRSQEFMPSKARLKFLKKMIILGPKTAILGPQFCRILVLGPHFWWSGAEAPGPPPDPPLLHMGQTALLTFAWCNFRQKPCRHSRSSRKQSVTVAKIYMELQKMSLQN